MEFASLFSGLYVGDLFPSEKTIRTFNENNTVAECLKIMETENVLSAPVVSRENKLIGIVDILDIVLFILGMFPKEVPIENLNESELKTVINAGSHFDSTSISSVLELSMAVKSNYQHVFTVKKSTPIEKLLEMFYEGVHRVLVLDEEENKVLNVISQSDLLETIAQCLAYISKKEKCKTVQELTIATSKEQLRTVFADDKCITVLAKMQYDINRPIYSAVPVVDSDGRLVASFSASNLKGLNESNFVSLLLPVLAFLTIQPETRDFKTNLARFKSLHPVTCTPSTSFENVVEKMVAHKVHRLWVVENDKPVGVISIGDIFKVLVPWARQMEKNL